MTDFDIAEENKRIEQRLLDRITDPEEKALVEGHFRKLEKIKAKYDPYRDTFPKGLDGGSLEEKKERREEENRFMKAWQPFLEKHKK